MAEHEALIGAIRDRKGPRVKSMMREHVTTARDIRLQMLREAAASE